MKKTLRKLRIWRFSYLTSVSMKSISILLILKRIDLSIIIIVYFLKNTMLWLVSGFLLLRTSWAELNLNWTEFAESFVYLFIYILEGFGTFWNLLERGGRISISIWYWNLIWVKSRVEIEFGLNLKVSEVFFKKNCFGSPCYLTVASGGSFFLGGNKDTRRCFLLCLQDSSNSSHLFFCSVLICQLSIMGNHNKALWAIWLELIIWTIVQMSLARTHH